MRYVRIYTDAMDASHFADVEVETAPANFAPPAPSLNVSHFVPGTEVGFVGLPTDWDGDWHPTPRRQFFAVMNGMLESQVSDGEVRRFAPGDVVLLEDTRGKGHRTVNLAAEETFVLIAQLPD
jgi:quercetin dioxygenase-like cupin family protein